MKRSSKEIANSIICEGSGKKSKFGMSLYNGSEPVDYGVSKGNRSFLNTRNSKMAKTERNEDCSND